MASLQDLLGLPAEGRLFIGGCPLHAALVQGRSVGCLRSFELLVTASAAFR